MCFNATAYVFPILVARAYLATLCIFFCVRNDDSWWSQFTGYLYSLCRGNNRNLLFHMYDTTRFGWHRYGVLKSHFWVVVALHVISAKFVWRHTSCCRYFELPCRVLQTKFCFAVTQTRKERPLITQHAWRMLVAEGTSRSGVYALVTKSTCYVTTQTGGGCTLVLGSFQS